MKQSRIVNQTRTVQDFLKWLLAWTLALCCCIMASADEKEERQELAAMSGELDGTLVNINEFSAWIYANGRSGNIPGQGVGSRSRAGITYPRGTATVVFQDGMVWGGQVHDGQEPVLRVGGAMYNVGHVAGRILSTGIAEDPTSPEVNHVWRIRRDFHTADLRQDAAELQQKQTDAVTEEEIEAVRNRYRDDWRNWPVTKGAPFYDADDDGRYTPQFHPDGSPILFPDADEPGVANADQVVWLVANDLDRQVVQAFSGSIEIGVEMQVTAWGYARNDELGQAIFRRHRLIYEGLAGKTDGARIDSMYLTQWADPDLGFYIDDLAGCDTLLDLGFVYNGELTDKHFSEYALPPPAVGHTLLKGPYVASDGESGFIGLEPRQNVLNLKMLSFAGLTGHTTPSPPGTYRGMTLQWYNLMRGFRARPESPLTPFIDPLTSRPTKFPLYGDPITGSGWIDQGSTDRRFQLSTGPFQMAIGDTQDVVIGVVGGLGSDRLLSVAALKHNVRVARQLASSGFEIPWPASPSVRATELDGAILLNWGSDPQQVERIEEHNSGDFFFEGYNIYQLPHADASPDAGVKIVTFDIANDHTIITEPAFDVNTGTLSEAITQTGSNTGIVRSLAVKRDSLHSEPLYNGQSYHFAITAYSINPDRTALIRSGESKPAVVTVTPRSRNPGHRLRAGMADTISVTHAQGIATGEVAPIVIDPIRITGHDYRLAFETIITDIDLSRPDRPDTTREKVWHLLDTTLGDTLLQNQTNFSGDEDYLIVDGLQVKVMDAIPAIASNSHNEGAGIVEVAHAGKPLAPAQWDSAGFEFGGNTLWHDVNAEGAAEPYYVSAGGGAGNIERFARSIDNAAPRDFEMRFTTLRGGSFGWWVFSDGSAHLVPFQLWDIGIATPDDPSDDVRLIPLHFNGGTNDDWDLTYTDPALGSEHCSDWTYFYFDSRGYERYEEDARDGFVDDGSFGQIEYLARMILCDVDSNGVVAPPGTMIRIHTTKPFSVDDVYTFSTADYAPTFSEEQAIEDVEEINVFPNPYYGPFNLSTRFPRGFVTFNHLPEQATVRIFTLAGVLVRTLEKTEPGQFLRWDLQNESGRFVGGGIYVAHVEMPELATSKVLKLAVFPE